MKRILFALLFAFGAVASAQTPVVADGGVLNGASFAKGSPVAPGSIVSIFGSNLASSLSIADSIPLSNSLNNVSVTFNNIPAPLIFVSTGQINAQLPWNVLPGADSGAVNVVVTRGGTQSPPQTVQVATFAPGIFAQAAQNQLWGIVVNFSDNTLAWPNGIVPGSHPARAGDILTLYATGLGPVDPPVADGHNSLDKLRLTTTNPTVLIGGQAADLLGSALSPQFVGVNQINVRIPPSVNPGNAVPIQIRIGGSTSTDQVAIAIAK